MSGPVLVMAKKQFVVSGSTFLYPEEAQNPCAVLLAKDTLVEVADTYLRNEGVPVSELQSDEVVEETRPDGVLWLTLFATVNEDGRVA